MSDTELKKWEGYTDYTTYRDGSMFASVEIMPGESCFCGMPHNSIEAAKADMEILIGYADDYAKRHGAKIDWTHNPIKEKDGDR